LQPADFDVDARTDERVLTECIAKRRGLARVATVERGERREVIERELKQDNIDYAEKQN